VIPQVRTTATAAAKVGARPAAREVLFAISPNSRELLLRFSSLNYSFIFHA
jgi:hypothetical protein